MRPQTIFNAVSDDGLDLISNLLVSNPSARLTAKQVPPIEESNFEPILHVLVRILCRCVIFLVCCLILACSFKALQHAYFSAPPGPTPPAALVHAGFLQVRSFIMRRLGREHTFVCY